MFVASGVMFAMAICVAFFIGVSSCVPPQAHAETLSVASSSKYKVTSVSAKEKKAYDRAVAACMDYANQANPIVVDLSDLRLTAKQAKNVWTMIHANGELFWINCYNDTYTAKSFSLPCYYSDKKIDAMRVKFESAIAEGHILITETMAKKEDIEWLREDLSLQKFRLEIVAEHLRS